ncbi:hypothetical protein CAC42_5345 [Sphaceloma murrayae]|uniref:Rhodopsin domain-containing protein n=1 Tax=Sphaceloma murrayae TaxID=2082308 RepID=A0A2K1QUR5_9PEZI|nr:hypothetical protein CAC42_5345 [Sphaceloma murrayae]
MADSEATMPLPNIHPELYIALPLSALVLASVCLSLRLYVRAVLLRAIRLDDYLLISAYIVFASHALLEVSYGLVILHRGLETQTMFALAVLQFQGFLCQLSQVLIKAALAVFYLHILPLDSWQRPVLVVTYALFATFTFVYAWVNLFQCGDPLDLLNPAPKCLSLDALSVCTYVSMVANMTTDWLMTLLPVTVIWSSAMDRKTKASVAAVMFLGASASVVSMARIPLMHLGLWTGPQDFAKVTPFTMLAFWENCVGIMAVALAGTMPLFRKMLGEQPHGGGKEVLAKWTVGGGEIGRGSRRSSRSVVDVEKAEVEGEGSWREREREVGVVAKEQKAVLVLQDERADRVAKAGRLASIDEIDSGEEEEEEEEVVESEEKEQIEKEPESGSESERNEERVHKGMSIVSLTFEIDDEDRDKDWFEDIEL